MTAAILRQVCDLGYVVIFSSGEDELCLLATHIETKQVHSVTIDQQGEQGLYLAACELADKVGIDLRDG